MFKKILYPTDFSDVSQKALDYIKQLKETGSVEVVVLHVINNRIIEGIRRHMADESRIEEFETMVREEANQSLIGIETELKKLGYKIKRIIKTGIPLREILRIEEEEDVSVIVVGSHGRTNLEEVFLGSVSEKVIRKCKKPILVIKR